MHDWTVCMYVCMHVCVRATQSSVFPNAFGIKNQCFACFALAFALSLSLTLSLYIIFRYFFVPKLFQHIFYCVVHHVICTCYLSNLLLKHFGLFSIPFICRFYVLLLDEQNKENENSMEEFSSRTF